MKKFFAKKTIKILTAAIFGVFVLVLFFAISHVYAETTRIEKCDWSLSGQCVVTIKEFKEDGKKITRVMEIPMSNEDEIDAEGRVKDEYTDSDGKKYYRMGTADIHEKVTFTNINDWKTSEEYEKALNNLNSPGGTFNKNQLEDSGSGGKFIFTLLQPLPIAGGYLKDGKNVTLKDYLTWAYKFVLALTGFLAVMMIVIGGVEWIISGASESMRSEAKKHINGAITGLIIALVAYLVLYTINPSLVDFESNWFFKEKETTNTDTEVTEEYTGTGVALTSEEKNTSYVNAEGYDVSKNVIITTNEDGSESYAITETYTDKDGNIYTTRTTKDKEDVFSTKKYVQYKGQSEDTLISEDESNPNYDFSGWDGS